MTIKSVWAERATSRFKEPVELSAMSDFEVVLEKLKAEPCDVPSKFHFVICFNDDTSYHICERYDGMPDGMATLELKRCAALVVPTNDSIDIPADCNLSPIACSACCEVAHRAITDDVDLDKRLIWRNVYSCAVVAADPYGENLHNLADCV